MENQLSADLKENLIDFQTSLTHYIHTIEAFIGAVEERNKASPDSSYTMSVQILEQILQQMLLLAGRRLPLDALENLVSINDISFNQIEEHQNNTISHQKTQNDKQEKEVKKESQKKLPKPKKPSIVLVDEPDLPMPWKPKN